MDRDCPTNLCSDRSLSSVADLSDPLVGGGSFEPRLESRQIETEPPPLLYVPCRLGKILLSLLNPVIAVMTSGSRGSVRGSRKGR
ncbi:hypothetical protein HYQ46_005095 [Verticillium longisporum]|nr:hypothetical protein HYQ46_005095 [Verticillium longisporum]